MTGAGIAGASGQIEPLNLHATCIALNDKGLLILGPSGSGKSALALQLMAWGAQLVADDRTEVFRHGDALIAQSPASLSGVIEARGIGLLNAPPLASIALVLVVDLSREEMERLPPMRQFVMLGVTLDLVFVSPNSHFPAAVLCYLKGGRRG